MKVNNVNEEEIKKLSEENEKILKSKKINPKILKNTENSMTFLVEENLGEPRGKLEMKDVKQYFEMLSNNNPIYHTSENMSEKLYTNNHSVIMGYFEAYEKHCPMTITPDIIWLLISQGFTHHILHNFEELRNEFVDFYGKKELKVKNNFSDIESVDSKSWNEFFEEIVNQIAKYTGEEIINILSPNFSTTDKISLQVGNITIMGAMENFFIYKMYLMGCGISKINLEGTLEDWEKILEKTNKLRKYELDWWIDEIEPIIKNIISTKKGIIDGDFWIRFIYNEDRFLLKGLSGIMTEKIKAIGGWLLKFYPYLNKGKRKGKLDTIAFETLSKLGSEFLPVRFKVVNVPKNTETDCKIFAGFIGMKQDQESMSVIPEIGWFVCKDDKEKIRIRANGVEEIL